MKQCDTMHAMACRAAISKGPRVVKYNGKDYVAYAMTKAELDAEIYAPAGYNTDTGSAWLRQIFRWSKFGTFTFPEFVVTDPSKNDWWVAFLTLTSAEQARLDDFALEHHYPYVLKG